MREEAVTDESLRYVLSHLWERGQVELAALGLTTDQAFDRFKRYAAEGFKARTLVADAPVIVVGIASDECGAFTWFQATDEFERYASFITRYVRREAKAYPGPLSIYSVCVHPLTERWFKTCGFHKDNSWAKALPSGAVLRKFDRK